MLGRRQAVSHGFLVPAFGGSNPPAPAIIFYMGYNKKVIITTDEHRWGLYQFSKYDDPQSSWGMTNKNLIQKI